MKNINFILTHMMNTRPRKEVVYRPFQYCPAVLQRKIQRAIEVDLYKLFPESRKGEYSLCSFIVNAERDADLVFCISGDAEVILNGATIRKNGKTEYEILPIKLNKGVNSFSVRAQNTGERFGFDFCISVSRYPNLWADDYLFSARPCIPDSEFEGQTGMKITEPFSEDTSVCTAFPKEYQPEDRSVVSFNGAEGNCAYALSYVTGYVKLRHSSPIKVFNGAEEIYFSDEGVFEHNFIKQSPMLVKCIKGRNEWGFTAEALENAQIPFVELSAEKDGLQWLRLEGFFREHNAIHTCFPPEYEIQFERPYYITEENKTFWKFNKKDTYLRPTLDSIFFGQWFYALMVGLRGLKAASELYNNREGLDYYKDSIKIMLRYYELMRYDSELFDKASFLARSVQLDNLDAIGTIGVNIAEYYEMTNDREALPVLQNLIDALMNNIPRFDDGTFHRIETMWADDIYMSCPFLVRMGRLTGKSIYFDEAIRQIKGYEKRMWMKDKNIFSHIYFVKEEQASRVPWGRGNGWILISLTEILEYLPREHSEREYIENLFKKFALGYYNCLDKEIFMWHQVLDRKESYPETSCTAIGIISLLKGIRIGLLDIDSKDVIRIWQSLLDRCIDSEGNVHGVCMGSGCSMEAEYYFDIPTAVNDDHGTGLVLLAGCEAALTKKAE